MSDTQGSALPPKPNGNPAQPASTTAQGPASATPRPVGAPLASVAPAATPVVPTVAKPAELPTRRSEGHAPIIPTPRRDSEQRRLVVGREVSLSGEINSCERLIIEGNVEANLTNCREVEIAESGILKGTAAIEEAEVRGRFDGSLTVRKRLIIKTTGRVSGQIRYGQIEIEAGGQISGDVQAQSGAEDEPRTTRPLSVLSSAER